MKNLVIRIRELIAGRTVRDSNILPIPSLDWHESFIVHLASIIRPKVYVELGLYQCAVFNQIIPYTEKLIGVDIEPSAGKYMTGSPKTLFVCASTQEFAHSIQSNPFLIDLLFIDADHSKESVLSDFRNIFPFVSPHGLILLHDTHPGNAALLDPNYCGTGYEAIAELSSENKDYEMVTIPVSPGLTICRKRQTQLSWQVA